MNGYDGLTEEQFYEMMSPEYRKKWPTEIDTLCKENDKESLADKYIEERNKARQYREKCSELRDKNQQLHKTYLLTLKENKDLQKEIRKSKERLISHRLKSFVAKGFNKMGFVPK